MTNRIAPFGDLGDFIPTSPKPKVEREVIDQVAADNGFPSRQPIKAIETVSPISSPASTTESKKQQRRHRTGRDKQINIKATDATIQRLYRLADERKVVLGELLELALDALEKDT